MGEDVVHLVERSEGKLVDIDIAYAGELYGGSFF